MPTLRTPFFGSAYRSRSSNLADQKLINLYSEIVETRSGKNVGAFYGCPGLDLKATAGMGPIVDWQMMGSLLYVVSGTEIFSIDQNFNVTDIGPIDATGVGGIINNGNQLAIFTATKGYLVPGGYPLVDGSVSAAGQGYEVGDTVNLTPQGNTTAATATAIIVIVSLRPDVWTGGFIMTAGVNYAAGDQIVLAPVGGSQVSAASVSVTTVTDLVLTGGTISSEGGNYNPGDIIYLDPVGGTQISRAVIQVTGTVSLGVTTFAVIQPGEFSVAPTGFIQGLTTGSGSGFGLTLPTFSGGLVTGYSILSGGQFSSDPTSFTQASTTGSGSGFSLGSLTFSTGMVAGWDKVQPGAFPSQPTSFIQNTTSGSGEGLVIDNLSFGAFVNVVPITLPYTPTVGQTPISPCFCDGFGLINQPGTNQMWQSNELDLSVWGGLNFASASGDPDNIVALAQQHREIFVFKQNEIEVWVNAGNPGFVFSRLTNVYIQSGTSSQFSIEQVGETLVYLAQNQEGEGLVVQLIGYTPTPVSTFAIDHAIQGYPTVTDARCYSYQQEGHQFYVVNFPSGNATWAYDSSVSALAGVPMWHQRAAFDNGDFSMHWGNCAISAFGFNLVGDYRNGNIYAFDLDQDLDNGQQRKWVRSWRALPQPSLDPIRFAELSIDMQTGIDVPSGTAPQVQLSWSDDGGHNWASQLVTAAGPTGATALRVRFNRLGSTRRNSGLDRIFELSSSDAFPVALIGADLR